ncbi:2715_t:CDS:2, partial [Scutellospora calospora]
SMNSSEEIVHEYIKKKKESLESMYEVETISENKKLLEGHILRINALVTSLFNISELTELISNEANIDTLNTTAIYKQEFKEFLESTLRSLQILQENSILFQNLIESEQLSIQELYNMSNNHTLITHLHDLITSSSFKEVQNLVDIMYKDTNPHRHVTS